MTNQDNNQWIDVEKLQQILHKYAHNHTTGQQAANILNDLKSLIPTPPLPTFEDMTAEEREASQWMQAQVFATSRTPGIITHIDEYARSAIILFTDGMAKNVPWKQITPLPGAKLKWPGADDDDHESEYCPACGATLLDDGPECEHCREDATLPRPQDVPEGEPWIVLCDDKRWVGVHADTPDRPWSITRMDGLNYRVVNDSEITLVSRLAPEATP